jgi:hypothetical protein
MKLSHIVIGAVAALALTACCYRPCPRPCAPAAPSYCAPVCAAPAAPARPVRAYQEQALEK